MAEFCAERLFSPCLATRAPYANRRSLWTPSSPSCELSSRWTALPLLPRARWVFLAALACLMLALTVICGALLSWCQPSCCLVCIICTCICHFPVSLHATSVSPPMPLLCPLLCHFCVPSHATSSCHLVVPYAGPDEPLERTSRSSRGGATRARLVAPERRLASVARVPRGARGTRVPGEDPRDVRHGVSGTRLSRRGGLRVRVLFERGVRSAPRLLPHGRAWPLDAGAPSRQLDVRRHPRSGRVSPGERCGDCVGALCQRWE